jgi:hypothetical protein
LPPGRPGCEVKAMAGDDTPVVAEHEAGSDAR